MISKLLIFWCSNQIPNKISQVYIINGIINLIYSSLPPPIQQLQSFLLIIIITAHLLRFPFLCGQSAVSFSPRMPFLSPTVYPPSVSLCQLVFDFGWSSATRTRVAWRNLHARAFSAAAKEHSSNRCHTLDYFFALCFSALTGAVHFCALLCLFHSFLWCQHSVCVCVKCGENNFTLSVCRSLC